MSLDVTIIYKKPKKENYWNTHAACGSTVLGVDDNYEEEVYEWSANITHNMGKMASAVPIKFEYKNKEYNTTLYMMVWRPDEVEKDDILCNTNALQPALILGMNYMIDHKEELLQYNPENGWGDYDTFFDWLGAYLLACIRNPDCKIEISR